MHNSVGNCLNRCVVKFAWIWFALCTCRRRRPCCCCGSLKNNVNPTKRHRDVDRDNCRFQFLSIWFAGPLKRSLLNWIAAEASMRGTLMMLVCMFTRSCRHYSSIDPNLCWFYLSSRCRCCSLDWYIVSLKSQVKSLASSQSSLRMLINQMGIALQVCFESSLRFLVLSLLLCYPWSCLLRRTILSVIIHHHSHFVCVVM